MENRVLEPRAVTMLRPTKVLRSRTRRCARATKLRHVQPCRGGREAGEGDGRHDDRGEWV